MTRTALTRSGDISEGCRRSWKCYKLTNFTKLLVSYCRRKILFSRTTWFWGNCHYFGSKEGSRFENFDLSLVPTIGILLGGHSANFSILQKQMISQFLTEYLSYFPIRQESFMFPCLSSVRFICHQTFLCFRLVSWFVQWISPLTHHSHLTRFQLILLVDRPKTCSVTKKSEV